MAVSPLAGDSWDLRVILRTMIPLLAVLSLVGLGAGSILETFAEEFIANPALIIMLPVVIAMGGNLGAIMASRLSTGLHVGQMTARLHDRYVLSHSVAVIALAATISFAMGVLAHLIGNVFGPGLITMARTLLVAVTTGLLLSLVVIVVAVSTTIISYRNGFDPDDTAIPVVTTSCDILGIIILTGTALVFL